MKYTKIISQELKKRLKFAFESLKADTKNPLVIALLKHPKAGEQIYLIAKDPTEEIYYGIMKDNFLLANKYLQFRFQILLVLNFAK